MWAGARLVYLRCGSACFGPSVFITAVLRRGTASHFFWSPDSLWLTSDIWKTRTAHGGAFYFYFVCVDLDQLFRLGHSGMSDSRSGASAKDFREYCQARGS